MHTLIVPKSNLAPPNVEDLMSWQINSSSSWGINVTYRGKNKSISIDEPLEDSGCKSFQNGEKLVFSRAFEGREGEKHHYEILQKFGILAFDLHFLAERNAYRCLDTRGAILKTSCA